MSEEKLAIEMIQHMKITFIIAFMKIIASLVLCQPLYHSASNNYKSIDLSTSSFIPFPIAPFLRRPCYPLPHPLPTLEAPLHSHFPPSTSVLHPPPFLLLPPPTSPPSPWFRMKPRLANVMKMRATHFLPPSPKHTQPNPTRHARSTGGVGA